MASFGSQTFVSETKIQSSAITLRSNGYSRRPRFRFFANLPRKNLGPNPFEGLRGGNQAVRAIRKGSEGNEGRHESEDALQATIDKSKKVLDMQRGLLQQIAERKKLISSIKGSTAYSEEDAGGYEQEETSSLDTHLTDEASSIEDRNGSFPSSISRQSTSAKEPENEKELPRAEPLKRWNEVISTPSSSATSKKTAPSQVDPRRQLKNTTFPKSPERKSVNDLPKKTTDSDALPTFLTSASEVSTRENEKKMNSDDRNLAVDLKGEEAKPPPLAGANVMNIIIVAAECAPWSKTGGLGDVAGSLPKALARRGHRVMVVAPCYRNYAEAQDSGVRRKYKVGDGDCEVAYYQAYIDGVDFVFIDHQMFRDAESDIYGGHRVEVLKRMVLFCKAAVEVPWHIPCGGVCYGDGNLGFIANDWHTALLPVYLKAYYRDNGLMQYARSTLVIHNIAHQGRGPVSDFSFVDLPSNYLDLFRHYDPVGGEHFNIFAAGLKTSDRILTVSHGYAWELKTQEGGWGLHGIIGENDWKLRGIVNGIDTEEWSPESDVHLAGSDGYDNYSLETLGSGKPKCKAALQRELGLPVSSEVPLVGFVGRLDQQKGVDLIAQAIPWMVEHEGAQVVMLGTGRADLEQMLRELEGRYRENVRGWVGFSVRTSHRITAGADVILMPSRFEPCGLNQLYAMRYGTVPVVHAVGGLRDTVEPFDPFGDSGVGWTFDGAETGKLVDALGNCFLTFREYKESWRGLQRRGMGRDLSWDKAAESYEEVLVAAKYQW